MAEAAGGSWCGRFGGGDLVAASGGSIQGGDPRLQGDPQAVVDRDARTGRKAPSAQQRAAARGKTVRWNRFGTPQLLTGDGDYLATGLVSDPLRRPEPGLPATRPCSASMVPPLRTWSCWRARRSARDARTVPAALRRPSGRPRRACRGRRRRGQGRLRVVVTGWRRPRRRREPVADRGVPPRRGLCRKERRCRHAARRGGRLDRLAGRRLREPATHPAGRPADPRRRCGARVRGDRPGRRGC